MPRGQKYPPKLLCVAVIDEYTWIPMESLAQVAHISPNGGSEVMNFVEV